MPSWSIPTALCLAKCLSRWSSLPPGWRFMPASPPPWRSTSGKGWARARLLVLAVLYVRRAKWLRGHLFTRLSLESAGLWLGRLACRPAMPQSVIVGAYGLPFLTILLGASSGGIPPGLIFGRRAPGRRRWRIMLALFACCSGLAARRGWRLNPTQTVHWRGLTDCGSLIFPSAKRMLVRLLCLRQLAALAGSPAYTGTGQSHPSSSGRRRRRRLSCSSGRLILLWTKSPACWTGPQPHADHRRAPGPARRRTNCHFITALFIFRPGGATPAVYDKFHLVPFGEYVPFAGLLNRIGITKLTEGQEGFASGDGPHTYQLPGRARR